jgi:microcystin-dependent protein
MVEPVIAQFSFSRRRTRTYDASNDPNALLTSLLQIICPAGTIVPTLLQDEPGNGWKICDGQALAKADYPRLFDILGATFGETTDTFNLPDLRGRTPFGASVGIGALMALGGAAAVTLDVANLPAHRHTLTDPGHGHSFTASPHSHTVTDPGHSHGALVEDAGEATAGAAVSSVTSGATATATTGITLGSATVTGTVGSATTGITMADAGEDEPISILPPYIAVNWMVRT